MEKRNFQKRLMLKQDVITSLSKSQMGEIFGGSEPEHDTYTSLATWGNVCQAMCKQDPAWSDKATQSACTDKTI